MKLKSPVQVLMAPIAAVLLMLINVAARAAFVPVAVSGYNADVVANGVGSAVSSITADVDGAGYAFMASDFNPLGALPTAYLPPSGMVYSAATSGVTFQLASYTTNNSLRLTATNSGTLTFSTTQSASDVYLLGVSGSGASTATITVTFTDATTQVFTGVAFSDWYGGSNFAIRGLGRVNTTSNGIDNNPSDPRLYEIRLSLSAANYSKQIASITVAKTATAGVINVMGVAINTVSSCSAPVNQPYALSVTPALTSATVTFAASIPAADKYLVVRTSSAALNTMPVNSTTYTTGTTLGNGTVVSAGTATSFSDASLTAATTYRYTVFAYNDLCSGGPLYDTTGPLTTTAVTASATSYTNLPASGYNADVVADTAGSASTSTTADVDGGGYAFMAPNFNPTGTTFPTAYLPATGLINSATTSGLSFQLQSYKINNSLRIASTGTGTLTLSTPVAASDIYLLATSGSGASTVNVTVTFTDATTQTFNAVSVSDWYSGSNYAILGVGRVAISTNTIDNNTSNPRLYEIKLSLSSTNYSRQIASVTFNKTSTAGVLNVMGLAAITLPGCSPPASQPTGLTMLAGTTSANVSFTASAPQSNKYLVVRTVSGATLTASPVNSTIYTTGAAFGNGIIVSTGSANVISDAGLTPGTLYRYTVFAYNDVCTGGPVYNTTSPLSGTVTTNSNATYTWTGATSFTYTVPSNWTPARLVPDVTDILQFNNGATNGVYGVPTQTVGRIVVSNNTTVMLQSSAVGTLTIASDNNAATDELSVAGGSTLLINGSALTTSSLTLAFSGTGATANIAGTVETFGLVTYGGNNFFNCANATVTVASTGTLATGGTQTTAAITGNTVSNLIINGTFIYKYSSTNNPAMPTATWNTGSTTIISGFNTATGGPNGGMGQSFYNFTYDCKSQTSNTNWSGTGPLTVAGTFTVSSTGTGTLQFSSTQGYNYQVNNFTQTGGTLNLNSGVATATPTLNVSGTFNQTAGTFTSTGASTGANAPVLNFNGTAGAQNINFYNAAPVGPITYRIGNPNGINLTGSGTLTGAFNLNTNGGVRISSTAANPINTTLTLTYNASGTTLTYDANGSPTMTANVFPTTSGPVNLTINTGGSANIVTMPFSRSIPGTLTMTSGDINIGTNTLTLGTSATAAGTLTYTAGYIRVGSGGSFVRWFGTSGLPTTAGTGVGFFPVGYNGLNRSVAFFFSSATALSTGGTIGVSHTNTSGFTNSLSVSDGAYTIDTRTNSSWSFATNTLVLSGTLGLQLTGAGLFTSSNPANLRVMKASAVAGTHVAGFGSTAQRSGLSLTDLASALYIGAAAADITGVYTAITTGNWSSGSTWDIGVAPGSANDAYINPGVTVTSNATTNTARSLNILPGGTLNIATGNTVTLDSVLQNNGTLNLTGGTLAVSGRANVSGIQNNGAGLISVSSGNINLGPSGGGAVPFLENGILTVTGGVFNINGYLSTVSASTINQSGGNINVDGNAGGVAASSVPCGTPIVSLNNAANNFIGGTFTVVDPHACTTGTNTFVYGNAANISASGTHTFRMGDGVSTDPGGQTPYNFSVNTSVSSTGKFAFYDLVINTGTATNSYFVQGASTMGVAHDLIVNSGGEFRNNASSQTTYINNNLTVNSGGTFTGLGTVAFANFSTGSAVASTNTQTVSGAGTFRNLAASPTAKFNSMTVNNSGGGVTLNIGNVNYSGALTFTLGKIFTGTNILQQNAGASVSGPAQTTGWVVGKFQKNATAGGLSHSYPVGDINFYTPLSIAGTAATAGDIVVGAVATDHPNLSTSSINPSRSVNRYWSISQANGLTFSSAGATVTPNWNAADIDAGATTANFIVGRYSSGIWTVPAVSSPAATSIVGTVAATAIDGEYAIGETCSPLSILTQPTAQTVCAGSSVTFSVVVAGTAGVLYQWQKNGNPITGATSSTYTIPATTTADAGSYTVVISSQCGGVTSLTSATAALTVNAPPAISTQPVAQTICEHGNVTFSVTASGTGITYQWQKNGTAITGATTSSYSITNISLSDSGDYTVMIGGSSPCGNLLSSVAKLTVNPLPLTITAATTTTFCAGGSVVLNAATGYTYQWQLNGTNISGATGASYTANASGSYTVLISNATTGCNGTSNAISVIANSPPTSSIAPAGTAAYCSGGTVTLTGPTTGGLTYQWNLNGSPISGATNVTYAAGAAGSYTLTVAAGTGCTATSSATVVSMNPLPTATVTAASGTTICAGTSVTLNANTGTGLAYVWKLNGTPITPSATGTSYSAGAAGTYTVTVTNTTTGCQNTSPGVTVTVNPLPTATITAAGPTSFCQRDSVTLNANTGTGLSYVWNLNGSPISPAVITSSLKVKTAGSYSVTVTNTTTGCQQTSTPVSITVNPLPNVTVTASGPLNMCAGSNVTLSVPGTTGQTYQWMFNGSSITGGSNASYATSAAGTYSVAVAITASGCKDTSAGAVITVNALPTATITPVGSTTACFGDTVWLNANTGSSLTYQWKLNGVAITGATNASYPATGTGSYTVTVTNGSNCSTTATQVNVTINPRPTSNITYTTPVTFCEGGAVVLTAVSNTAVTYQWYNNAVQMTGATNNFYIASTTGNYSVTVTNGFGCSAISPAIPVVVNPLPQPTITAAAYLLSTGSYDTYQWYFNSAPIPGANGQSYNVTRNGGYSVRVTDANGCTNYSSIYFFNSVGVPQIPSPDAVKVYPNPAHLAINIDAPIRVNASLRDVTGRIVLKADDAKQIDLSHLADGAYLLQITDQHGSLIKTEKLIKSGD
jgi:hypothetical protein